MRAESFVAAIESALPGSGLGHAYLKAGWRAATSVRGVTAQLGEIADKAGVSIVEYNNRDTAHGQGLSNLEEGIR